MFNSDKTYIINLPHRTDRLRIAKQQFEKAGIPMPIIFPAIDARRLKLRGTTEENQGLIGCFMSHYFILQNALMNNYESIAVFEDDVIFVSDFKVKYEKAKSELPDTWQLFMLGYYEQLGKETYKLKYSENLVIPKSTWGTHGYIVRKEGIKIMYDNLQTIKTHIDIQISNDIAPKLYTYCAYPALCHQSGIKSDIK